MCVYYKWCVDHLSLASDVVLGDKDKHWDCNVDKIGKDVLQCHKDSDADVVEKELSNDHVQ